MLIFAFDPGKTGAWAVIDHHSDYQGCGDMIHDNNLINTEKIWDEICSARNGHDCLIVVEAVHSMPRDGVRQAFSFGASYGAVLGLAQRFKAPLTLVPPSKWKLDMQLTSDKNLSLEMARQLWPTAPLTRKKDNGRAEALLMAEWLRKLEITK